MDEREEVRREVESPLLQLRGKLEGRDGKREDGRGGKGKRVRQHEEREDRDEKEEVYGDVCPRTFRRSGGAT